MEFGLRKGSSISLWKEGNGENEDNENKNGRKYVLGDKSYSVFDAMVLPEFAKKEEGRVCSKERAFQWHLGVRWNWRIQK